MDVTLVLDAQSGVPLYGQVYDYFQREIAAGRFAAGVKLPSVRQLALVMHVSKMTVETAYQQLVAEGYVESRAKSGFYVREVEEFGTGGWPEAGDGREGRSVYGVAQGTLSIPSEWRERPADSGSPATPELASEVRYNFHGSVIDIDKFPMTLWRRCLAEALDVYGGDLAFYGHPQGEYELRVEIAKYLREARMVRCEPERILVGSGLQQTISFLCLLLQDEGKKMAWEDPGYADARTVCIDHGWEVVPVPLEEDGIDIGALATSGANAVLVTPAHQYPFGMVMPIGKRLKLLEWAKRTGGVILEEDYDGEFRYGIKPVPSLQGMDANGDVVFIGNFSKAFSPAVRMNYTVLPPRLLQRYHERNFRKYPNTVSRIEQRAMQLFMQKGHWAKHVRKMRQVYARKQALLVDTLHACMGERVKVMGQSAGLHLLVEVHAPQTEQDLLRAALAYGVKVYPVAHGWAAERPRHASEHARILLGFGGLREQDIAEGVQLLKQAWFG